MSLRRDIVRTILGFSIIGTVAAFSAPFFFYFIAPGLFQGVSAFGVSMTLSGFPFISIIFNFYLQLATILLGGLSAAFFGATLGFAAGCLIGATLSKHNPQDSTLYNPIKSILSLMLGNEHLAEYIARVITKGLYVGFGVGALVGIGLPLYMLGAYTAIVFPLLSWLVIGTATCITAFLVYRYLFPDIKPALQMITDFFARIKQALTVTKDLIQSFKKVPAAEEGQQEINIPGLEQITPEQLEASGRLLTTLRELAQAPSKYLTQEQLATGEQFLTQLGELGSQASATLSKIKKPF